MWRAGFVQGRTEFRSGEIVARSLHKGCLCAHPCLGQLECEQDRATCRINDLSTQVLPFSPEKNHT